jgi:hypothetical protein
MTPLPGWAPFVQPTPQYRGGGSPFDPVTPSVPVASAPPEEEVGPVTIVAIEPEVPRSFWETDPAMDGNVIVPDDSFTPIDFDDELGPQLEPAPPAGRGFFLALLLVGGTILAAREGVI